MGGFVALFNSDGRPVEEHQLLDMMAAIAHRGGAGEAIWYSGNVGLGVRLSHDAIGSGAASLVPPETEGRIIIAADARIDNRDDLLPILRPRHADISDSAIIALAYEKWGERCLDHLIGDFAFALWDARRHSLFAARDHIGVKPFFYFESRSKGFAAGSTIGAVLAGRPTIDRAVDEQRVAQYLLGVFDDVERTFYHRIKRLPASHALSIARAEIYKYRYAVLKEPPTLYLRSDEEYAEAFREKFTEAVRCRLRSRGPVGAALSGGLDSSSVVCVARELQRSAGREPLHTFSIIFEDVPESDERPYIEAVLAGGDLLPHFIHGDRTRPLPDIAVLYDHLEEPFSAPNMALHWEMFKAARQSGVHVWLDGLDGDTTVSHGIGFLVELATHMRWLRLSKELRALSARMGIERAKLFRSTVVNPLLDPVRSLRDDRIRRGGRLPANAWRGSAINPELAARYWPTGFRESSRPRTAVGDHLRRLRWGLHPFLLEALDRAASSFALEPRYPFYDRRLIEFCLSLPGGEKLRDGWTRWILRSAMEEILPEKIRWRTDKGNPGPSFMRTLRMFEGKKLRDMVEKSSRELDDLIDMRVMREYVARFEQGANNEREVMEIWKGLTLATWLERRYR